MTDFVSAETTAVALRAKDLTHIVDSNPTGVVAESRGIRKKVASLASLPRNWAPLPNHFASRAALRQLARAVRELRSAGRAVPARQLVALAGAAPAGGAVTIDFEAVEGL